MIIDIMYGKQKFFGYYKNKDKKKVDIQNITLNKPKSYSSDNYTYYYAYKRLKKRT